ncbi:uncharacterized protein LOC8059490 isoform X3 [Sorghum bicolor]|uniref:Uncharacterized protein n=2 Tax=Sorghum bicolor TaxID=4558 RepID=A0A1Z5SBV2_SORBI|nr:uncharacterized protein LOC8059490 isoform X3 [Sorghum bicolor]OQU93392.1 hypothetical protein SORBI_3001G534066 [Sorghum bicolor]|eukprot:XP_021306757.1 uncharacterized protein LOC8059490 isoform X3 [Sorghum bicolor]
MNNCLENYEKMRELGLDVSNAPFAGFGEDEHNSDDHPNVDNLEPEKDDSLQELDNVISRLIAKSSKKVTKTGGQKVQPQNQAGTLTRSNAKKASATEISNQTTEEGDAAEQNACQTEEDNIQTVLNQDGSIENGMDSADDLFDEEVRIRGPNIGKKLDKMTRSKRGKLPLVIEPGKKRPSSVMIAAKFASECNIAVRGGVPIFPKWKDYKEKSSRPMIKAYINSVCSKFEADKESVHVKRACVAMLKQAICQQRHKLKMKHFDPFPLHKVPKKSPVPSMDDAQWDTLVEYWKSEKRMLTCEKNKTNRSKVQFHQKTGSRSYEMELINLASKYQDEPPNAFDRFKDLHYSKKKGFTPTVQSAIVEMEDKINAPVQDGEEPKDVADIVHEVLAQKTKKNKFLVNVGLKRSSATEDYAESQHELQAELLQEKQTTSELKEVVKAQQMQMDEMMKKFQKGEIARAKQDEEYKKKQDETNALIRGLMSMIPASQPTR